MSSKSSKLKSVVSPQKKTAEKLNKKTVTRLDTLVTKIKGVYMKTKSPKLSVTSTKSAKPVRVAPSPAKVATKNVKPAMNQVAKKPAASDKTLKKPVGPPELKHLIKNDPPKGKLPLRAAEKVPAPVPALVKTHKPKSAKAVKAEPPAPLLKGSRAKAAAIAAKTGLPPTSLRGRGGDVSGEAVCREVACEGLATTASYCRLHYIKNWKKIKRKELILKEGKLNQYIEELVAKYPDKYIEAIRQDLAEDKNFAKVIYDLDLDEGVDDFDPDSENVDSVIESIKRDFEDDGDSGF